MNKFDVSKPATTVWRCDTLRRPYRLPATITAGGYWAVLTDGRRKVLGKTVCLTEAEAYALWVRRLTTAANNKYLRIFMPGAYAKVVDALRTVNIKVE